MLHYYRINAAANSASFFSGSFWVVPCAVQNFSKQANGRRINQWINRSINPSIAPLKANPKILVADKLYFCILGSSWKVCCYETQNLQYERGNWGEYPFFFCRSL